MLAVAARLLALDRFYGATSGWVRYLLTAQQLNQALDDLEIAFEAQKLDWDEPDPCLVQARAAMELAQSFMKQANSIVGHETKAWATEFADVLKQIDETTKTAGQAKQQAAIQITVMNADQCEDGWKLAVGTRPPEDRVGTEASVEVPPGLHILRASANIGGKPVQAEKAVNVAVGQIQNVDLTLK